MLITPAGLKGLTDASNYRYSASRSMRGRCGVARSCKLLIVSTT